METLILARGELRNWRERSRLRPHSFSSNLMNILIGVILMGIFIFIFVKIGLEVSSYHGVIEGLLALYLFIFFAVCSLVSAVQLRHSLFESRMAKAPFTWPVNKAQIIVSKSLVSLIKTFLFSVVLSLPIWITYGIVAHSPWYIYFLAILYPFLISVAEVAVGFLLCVPIQGVNLLLRKNIVLQIVFGCACALILAFLYGEVLDVFVKVIVNGDLNGVLQIYELSLDDGWGRFLYPVAFLVQLFTRGTWANIGFFFAMVLGLFGVGSLLAWPTYFRIVAQGKAGEIKVNWRMPKSPKGALLSKELSLMFRGRGGASGLVTLVVSLPIVCYFVVASMNYVFSIGNLKFVPVFFPMFTAGFTGMMILMTAASVCTCSMDTIRREGPKLCLMKLAPVSMEEQLAIKGLVPLALTALSFACSMVVLGVTSLVDWTDFGWLLAEGLAFLVAAVFFELIADARAKVKGKKNETLWESLMPFIFPVIIYGITIVTSAFLPKYIENYSYQVFRNINHLIMFVIFAALAVGAGVFTFKRGPAFLEAQAAKAEE